MLLYTNNARQGQNKRDGSSSGFPLHLSTRKNNPRKNEGEKTIWITPKQQANINLVKIIERQDLGLHLCKHEKIITNEIH